MCYIIIIIRVISAGEDFCGGRDETGDLAPSSLRSSFSVLTGIWWNFDQPYYCLCTVKPINPKAAHNDRGWKNISNFFRQQTRGLFVILIFNKIKCKLSKEPSQKFLSHIDFRLSIYYTLPDFSNINYVEKKKPIRITVAWTKLSF